MKRVLALGIVTFLEGIRNRALFGIFLFSLFILALNVLVAGFFLRDVGKVTLDMNQSAISLAGLMLVFFVFINLMAKDIDRKTVQLVLSKPISRGEYIWGKFLGASFIQLAALSIILTFSIGTISLVKYFYPNFFHGFSWGPFFLSCLFIFIKLSVVTSVVIFFCSITTSSFVAQICSLAIYVVGESIEEVVFYLTTTFSKEQAMLSEGLRNSIEVIKYVVPNLSAFDFKIEASHGIAIGSERILFALNYGVIYILIMLVLATAIFRRREFN